MRRSTVGRRQLPASVVVCGECDWLMRLPARRVDQSAHCPRCGHHIATSAPGDGQPLLAFAVAALVALGLVFAFPFLGFSKSGIGHVMDFVDTVSTLVGGGYGELALLLLATTVVFPALYLAALVFLCAAAQTGRRLPGAIPVARWLRALEPWMMSDVFIVGVLVSLVKIVSLADIHIRASFVAFCGFSAMLLITLRLVDWARLWAALAPAVELDVSNLRLGTGASSQNVVACRACQTAFHLQSARRCPRCGTRHRQPRVDRRQLTWALLVTSVIALVPANLYPILYTVQLGNGQPQTIAAGILGLIHHGDWPIALIIFVASMVVPISKILALAWLCLQSRQAQPARALTRTRAYRIIEKVGRWSMIDVFVVAVLGALVQAGSLMSIQPGPAAVPFASVVILTMIAAHTFDTRWLWERANHNHNPHGPGEPRAAGPGIDTQ